jgi:uncharacterized protein
VRVPGVAAAQPRLNPFNRRWGQSPWELQNGCRDQKRDRLSASTGRLPTVIQARIAENSANNPAGLKCADSVQSNYYYFAALHDDMSNLIDPSGFAGCFRCFHVWKPRHSEVGRCPRCKSQLWDVPKLSKIRRGGGLGIGEIIGPRRDEVLAAIRRYKAGHPRVFGSVARGSANRRSDVDFLVEREEGMGLFDRIALVEDLERILGRRVDVTTVDGLHWIVRPQVLVESVPL